MLNPDKPIPSAEDVEDARQLAWRTVDLAIALYEEAKACAERCCELLALDPTLNPWSELETRRAVAVEGHLVNCLLATDPTSDRFAACDLERYRAPVRGVRSGGVTYLAAPVDPRETEPGRAGGPILMRLVVIPARATLDLDDVGAFAERTRRPVDPPRPTVKAPPPRPAWLETIIKAAETLGKDEAMARMFLAPPRADC